MSHPVHLYQGDKALQLVLLSAEMVKPYRNFKFDGHIILDTSNWRSNSEVKG